MFICKVFDKNNKAFKVILSSELEVIGVIEIDGREYMHCGDVILQQNNLSPIDDDYLKDKIKSVVYNHLSNINNVINNAFN